MKNLVAMSGGVDSSVAAYLLQKEGHEVAGITMMLGYRNPDGTITRIGESAADDAAKVCSHLGIQHFIEDCILPFGEFVISNFVEEYKCGRTPNPCVRCNRLLKFGHLFDIMKSRGFDRLATGHYAGIESFDNELFIRKNSDPKKDQSYFLYAIRRQTLPFIVFPLNIHGKSEIRKIASQTHIPVAYKKDSQDICFIKDDYREFIAKRISNIHEGNFVSTKGKILGAHNGIPFYTIGQRRGLGVSAPAPLYVISFNLAKNEIVLGYREDLKSNGLVAKNLSFFTDRIPSPLTAKIRYAHKEIPCRISISGDSMQVIFDEAVDSVTSGQSVVLYHDDLVIGGGVIEKALENHAIQSI
jgi:tRNA-uridine 2-sulfurtransferase